MSRTGILFWMMILCGPVTLAGGEEIVLKSRRFTPESGLSTALHRQLPMVPDRVHVLVQLEGVPGPEWRADALRETGLRLLNYVPHHAWFASFPADQASAVANRAGVRSVCEILPEDKIAASIWETGINEYSTTADGKAHLTARFFEDVRLETGIMLIEGLGGRVLTRDEAGGTLEFHLPPGTLYTLAAYDGTQWIDQHHRPTILNDGMRAAIDADPVQADPYYLTGGGVVIGQWESGSPDANHVDLLGRVHLADRWETLGEPGLHATRVAGIMAGNGNIHPIYRGVATSASVVSFPNWTNAGSLRLHLQDAIHAHGIDIANNSWGLVEWHIYKDYAATMDDIVRGSLGKPVSMVWAVGNEGGWGTIFCTAVAKNIVSVGATYSDTTALWPWSNKGPTEDGRIKPDVVSPGCEANNGGSIWSTIPGGTYGGGGCGTSLAAPSVTGTMALILEDWRAIHESDPLPSTIKGLLMHTARDLGPPGPDYAHGYGLVSAARAIDLLRADTLDERIVEGVVDVQGGRDSYEVEVSPEQSELKVTLVWDDYPALPQAAHALINDLDLVVTDPNGNRHYPWTLVATAPEAPALRTRPDRTNNVEQVRVEGPAPGTWLVTVWATDLPQVHQAYSLLADGGGLSPAARGATVFSVTGYMANTVAEFTDTGDLILQGGLTTRSQCRPPAGSFVVWSAEGTICAYIDPSGDMCIRGDLIERAHCTLAAGGFPVNDFLGRTVASIDADGNLCLSGRLHQNP